MAIFVGLTEKQIDRVTEIQPPLLEWGIIYLITFKITAQNICVTLMSYKTYPFNIIKGNMYIFRCYFKWFLFQNTESTYSRTYNSSKLF